jgi:hypothetical protein
LTLLRRRSRRATGSRTNVLLATNLLVGAFEARNSHPDVLALGEVGRTRS